MSRLRGEGGRGRAARAVAGAAAAAALTGALTACWGAPDRGTEARRLTGGDPDQGKALVERYGCGTCHTIAHVPGAQGQVGPDLNGLKERIYIAGVLPNAPEQLIRWLVDPKRVDSLTAMPKLGLSEAEARDVASFLYTLR